MASYNKQKLIRIDEQILNLEYLYERELAREKELNKHTILLSRGFRYRLDNLYKARQLFVKTTGELRTKEMNYAITLAERKNALEDEEIELKKLLQKRDEAAAMAQIHLSAEHASLLLDYTAEIPKQEARVRNKRRALENWVNKAGNVQTTERKLHANIDIEALAKEALVAKDKYKEHLNSFPAKVENNATLDLLSSNPLFDTSGIMGETTTRRINTNIDIEEQKDENVD